MSRTRSIEYVPHHIAVLSFCIDLDYTYVSEQRIKIPFPSEVVAIVTTNVPHYNIGNHNNTPWGRSLYFSVTTANNGTITVDDTGAAGGYPLNNGNRAFRQPTVITQSFNQCLMPGNALSKKYRIDPSKAKLPSGDILYTSVGGVGNGEVGIVNALIFLKALGFPDTAE